MYIKRSSKKVLQDRLVPSDLEIVDKNGRLNSQGKDILPPVFDIGSSVDKDCRMSRHVNNRATALTPLVLAKDGETALVDKGHSLYLRVPSNCNNASADEDLPLIRRAMSLLIQHAKDSPHSSFDIETSLIQTWRDNNPTDHLGSKVSSVYKDCPLKENLNPPLILRKSSSSTQEDDSSNWQFGSSVQKDYSVICHADTELSLDHLRAGKDLPSDQGKENFAHQKGLSFFRPALRDYTEVPLDHFPTDFLRCTSSFVTSIKQVISKPLHDSVAAGEH